MTRSMDPNDSELKEALAAEADSPAAPQDGLEGFDGLEDFDFATLMAYRDGLLDPALEAEMQRLLVAEPELARALLDLEDLDSLAEAAVEAVGESPEKDGWHRFERHRFEQHRLQDARTSAPSVAREPLASDPAEAVDSGARERPQPPTPFRRFLSENPFVSLAATFLLALGLGWIGSGIFEDRSGQALDREWGPAVIEHLHLSDEAGPHRGERTSDLLLPQGTEWLVLALVPPATLHLDAPLPSNAEAVARQMDGPELRLRVRLQDEGSYLLVLPVEKLRHGPMEIDLIGSDGSEPLGSYQVTLSKP